MYGAHRPWSQDSLKAPTRCCSGCHQGCWHERKSPVPAAATHLLLLFFSAICLKHITAAITAAAAGMLAAAELLLPRLHRWLYQTPRLCPRSNDVPAPTHHQPERQQMCTARSCEDRAFLRTPCICSADHRGVCGQQKSLLQTLHAYMRRTLCWQPGACMLIAQLALRKRLAVAL